MRKSLLIAVALVLLFQFTAHAQVLPPVTHSVTLTSTVSDSDWWPLRSLGVVQQTITWNTTGTVSAGACGLQYSADGVTATGYAIVAQTVTATGGGPSLTSLGVYNYVRFHCSTAITGAGNVFATYTGFRDAPMSATFGGAITIGVVQVQDSGGGSICSVAGYLCVYNPALEACDSTAIYDTNTNGKTQLVALSSGKKVYVCGVQLTQSTTSAVTVSLGSGTGLNCVTTYTAKTPAWVMPASSAAVVQHVSMTNSTIPYFSTAASEELCISTSAGVSVQLLVTYSQR